MARKRRGLVLGRDNGNDRRQSRPPTRSDSPPPPPPPGGSKRRPLPRSEADTRMDMGSWDDLRRRIDSGRLAPCGLSRASSDASW